MENINSKLVSWLFDTKAIRVCPQDKPFWYTSGTIGPYYINTHFLYGSEDKANQLLGLIDAVKSNILECPKKFLDVTNENYEKDAIYKGLIDEMVLFIKNNIQLDEIDYISGGERRDWFFSMIIAKILNKPHVTIYKDLKTVVTDDHGTREVADLKGGNVLHIADLITEASSYERAWIPAIKSIQGNFKWSLVVVDRKQGGEELLSSHGVKSYAMVSITKAFFDTVVSMGIINDQQHLMIVRYIANPKEAMKSFLLEHPEFLENALNADEKTKERARLCLDKNIYELK
ncbi:MAG: orotate phosphoribosyltransferase [Clostridia bacterium]|nr:orotate phosphoribosyltransferase [Clostridia bacterium]